MALFLPNDCFDNEHSYQNNRHTTRKQKSEQASERKKKQSKMMGKEIKFIYATNVIRNFVRLRALFSFSLFFISYETLEGAYLAPVMAHKFICTN